MTEVAHAEINNTAFMLYGLIHARYIITSRGLTRMVMKSYKLIEFDLNNLHYHRHYHYHYHHYHPYHSVKNIKMESLADALAFFVKIKNFFP
jgi:hypothetical protein